MEKNKNLELGKLIKQTREEKGLSQRQLAKLVGVANSVVSVLESGNIFQPSIFVLAKLSKILEIDIWHLLDISNYSQNDLVFLQNLWEYLCIEEKPELIKKYLSNHKIDILKVTEDYKSQKISENDAIMLFIKYINIEKACNIVIEDKTE